MAHYPNTETKPQFVNQLFDQGAEHYDSVVNWGFFRTGARYRRWVQQRHGLAPGQHLLDVACGTGLVAVWSRCACLGTAENITCLDLERGQLLAIARTKLPARFVVGYAEHLPFPDNSFDFLTMGYALRHVSSLTDTFREYHRVLKPGGKLLIPGGDQTPRAGSAERLFRLYFGRIYSRPHPALHPQRERAADDALLLGRPWTPACRRPPSSRRSGTPGWRRPGVTTQLGLFSEYTAVKA